MNPTITLVNNFLSTLVVISQILTVFFIWVYFSQKNKPESREFQFIKKHALFLAFLVALTSTLGSLFYSEIAHYEPCKLCWFQRIFMYPQTIILGIALWKKNFSIWIYSITLSTIGGIIALNHYILQTTGSSVLPCSAVGYSVSCSKVFTMNFGYITIPLMALSGFLLMIISMMFLRNVSAK